MYYKYTSAAYDWLQEHKSVRMIQDKPSGINL